eukprot:9435931-Ditylum_brightwellii.AAC.1
MIETSHQPKILLLKVEENPIMALESKVSSVEIMVVNDLLGAHNTPIERIRLMYEKVPNECNEVASVLDGVTHILDDN